MLQRIMELAREIYADHPEWVEQTEKFLRERGKLR